MIEERINLEAKKGFARERGCDIIRAHFKDQGRGTVGKS